MLKRKNANKFLYRTERRKVLFCMQLLVNLGNKGLAEIFFLWSFDFTYQKLETFFVFLDLYIMEVCHCFYTNLETIIEAK